MFCFVVLSGFGLAFFGFLVWFPVGAVCFVSCPCLVVVSLLLLVPGNFSMVFRFQFMSCFQKKIIWRFNTKKQPGDLTGEKVIEI